MNHRAYGRLTDVGPLVALTNAVTARWPPGRLLEFVHAPFAAADDPPPLTESFYAPLAGLSLPAGTRSSPVSRTRTSPSTSSGRS